MKKVPTGQPHLVHEEERNNMSLWQQPQAFSWLPRCSRHVKDVGASSGRPAALPAEDERREQSVGFVFQVVTRASRRSLERLSDVPQAFLASDSRPRRLTGCCF